MTLIINADGQTKSIYRIPTDRQVMNDIDNQFANEVTIARILPLLATNAMK